MNRFVWGAALVTDSPMQWMPLPSITHAASLAIRRERGTLSSTRNVLRPKSRSASVRQVLPHFIESIRRANASKICSASIQVRADPVASVREISKRTFHGEEGVALELCLDGESFWVRVPGGELFGCLSAKVGTSRYIYQHILLIWKAAHRDFQRAEYGQTCCLGPVPL